MTADVLLLLAGFTLLTFAADRLVVAAARISSKFGLSPILIGALIVGFGTSLPEMLVSGFAAALPQGLDFALGNIVGSNIANLALVLGVSAMMSPIHRQPRLIKRQGSVMLVGSLVLAVLAFDNSLTRPEGIGMAVGLMIALGLIIRWSSQDHDPSIGTDDDVSEYLDNDVSTGREVLAAVVSLGLTLLGAELLVRGARGIAESLGVSDAVISLTLVAIGTSLPELATAVAAARRRENDLVLGNVIGSNLFNALGVGAVAGIVGGGALIDSFRGPLTVMIAVTALTGILALRSPQLGRVQASVLLLSYPLALLTI